MEVIDMIDKKSRRVVIINNIQSDTIDQAIFILKNQKAANCSKQNNIVHEAQTIIDQYIRQVDRLKPIYGQHSTKKRNRKRRFASSVLAIAAAAVFILLVFSFISHNI
jgi:hypothetical protein